MGEECPYRAECPYRVVTLEERGWFQAQIARLRRERDGAIADLHHVLDSQTDAERERDEQRSIVEFARQRLVDRDEVIAGLREALAYMRRIDADATQPDPYGDADGWCGICGRWADDEGHADDCRHVALRKLAGGEGG